MPVVDLDRFEQYLAEGGVVEAHHPMPDAYRATLLKFVEMHANSEFMGGLTEREWIPKAPGLKRKLAVLAKTQDEIGHGHLLYMVAADLGKSREAMLDDLFAGRSKFHNVFHYKAETWGDMVAIAYLVDAAALTTQRAIAGCSYGPYARVLRRIIAEEGFHMRSGEEMMLELADGTPAQHRLFQAALERWWWPCMHFFGPPSTGEDPLIRWRVRTKTNEALRDEYVQKMVPQLQGYGFEIPDPDLRRDERGKWVVGEIDWEPLLRASRNAGPESAARLASRRLAHEETAWVRAALDAAAARERRGRAA